MTSQQDESFDLALKAAILANRLTQRQLAKRTGIEYTRLSRIVCRRVKPLPEEVDQLVRVLNRAPFELFPVSA